MVIEIFLCRCRTYNDICIRKVLLTLFEVEIEIVAISFLKSVPHLEESIIRLHKV